MWSKSGSDGQKSMSFIEAARRAQIVESAIEVLAERGYAQTSLARIAERAAISKSIISYHFEGKDELMRQIVIEVYTKGAHFMLPRIQAESTARGMLMAFIQSNVEFIATHRRATIAATEVISNLRKPDGTFHFDQDADEPNVQGVEGILKRGQADGEFRSFDTRVMALTIRAAIDRLASRLIARPDLDWEAYARELCSTFDHATRAIRRATNCDQGRDRSP